MEIEETNLILRVIGYGVSKKQFVMAELYSALEIQIEDQGFIHKNLVCFEGDVNPNHIIVATYPASKTRGKEDLDNNCYVRLLPSALFNYIDHIEIVEARKVAKEAKAISQRAHKLSLRSIWISSVIGGVSLVVGLIQIYLAFKTNC